MTDLTLAARQALPDALRVLVEEYPREAWEAHPNFSGLIQFWLERHLIFRRLTDHMDSDVKAALDGDMDPMHYAQKLSRYGSILVGDLHMHHQIEDAHYFPVLTQQDPRVADGFAILDADHHEIDAALHGFAEAANLVLATPGETDGFRDRAAGIGNQIEAMSRLLHRHLTDEEELVVPVLLKYAPEGLA